MSSIVTIPAVRPYSSITIASSVRSRCRSASRSSSGLVSGTIGAAADQPGRSWPSPPSAIISLTSWLTWTIPLTRSWFCSSVTTSREWPVETQRRSAASTVSDDVDGHDRRDRRHHLAGLLLVEVEDAGEHVRLADVELPAGLGLGDDPLELVRRPALGFGVGIGSEHPQDRVGGRVQHEDERVEQHPEELKRPRDPAGDPLGVLDRVELGDDLAGDRLGDGDQQVGDDHGDHDRRGVADHGAEQRLEQVRDRGLAERADGDRGHRDPDLTGGDVVADVVELVRAPAGRRAPPPRPAPRAAGGASARARTPRSRRTR